MGYLSTVIRPTHWVAAAATECAVVVVYSPPVAAAAAPQRVFYGQALFLRVIILKSNYYL